MKYKQRSVPAKDALERISKEFGLSHLVSDVEAILSIISVSNRFREEVYGKLEQKTGLTEGKFIVLMALIDCPQGLLMGELAHRAGVADATATTMIKRMLNHSPALVAVKNATKDKRQRRVYLTEAGRQVVNDALPYHHEQIVQFMKPLSVEDKTMLTTILKKLI